MIPNGIRIVSIIPEDVKQEFKAVCDERDSTCSRTIRRLIIDYLIKIREEKEANEQS